MSNFLENLKNIIHRHEAEPDEQALPQTSGLWAGFHDPPKVC